MKNKCIANCEPNVVASFNPIPVSPVVAEDSYVHPLARLIGSVTLGHWVMVAPFACLRADEGQGLRIGNETNIQDGVILHGLKSWEHGGVIPDGVVSVGENKYSIYVGDRVSLAHQCQVHGPAFVGNDTFIGMQALLLRASVGKNCVVEPRCTIIGVSISDVHYVPAGSVINTQEQADRLPMITAEYGMRNFNEEVVEVNIELCRGYLERDRG
jgi:carbonic anhydrase/acetyltransferase-like protein (isoleucine patch superfamily)